MPKPTERTGPISNPSDDEPVALTLPLRKLGFIIAKAREYDAEVAPVDEDTAASQGDDEPIDILKATSDNPTRQELVDAIEGLNDDERIELLALLWLGRGDFNTSEWPDALAEARARHNKREAEYLAGTPLLSEYIEDALSELGYSHEDVEENGAAF